MLSITIDGAILKHLEKLYFFLNSIAELQIEPNQNHLLTNLEGSIFAWLFVHRHSDVTVVTVPFEDAQVIQTLMDVECWMMDD